MRERPVTNPPVEEHRTRVGRERRHRTRDQLLRAVFQVIDQQGMDRFSVERVRLTAGLSRGSFYSHFRTADELLAQLSCLIWAKVQEEHTELFSEVSDPLDRLCSYLRYGVARGASDAACGRVLLRAPPMPGTFGDEVRTRLLSEVSMALELGKANAPSLETAVDLGLAMIVEMLRSAVLRGPDTARLNEQITIVLQALGVSRVRVAGLTVRAPPTSPTPGLRDKILDPT